MDTPRILPFPDRRRYHRREIEVDVVITTVAGAVLSGVTMDVNDFGMAAIVFGELAPGDFVILKYADPDDVGRWMEREAVVKGWDGRHAGFEFPQAKRASQR